MVTEVAAEQAKVASGIIEPKWVLTHVNGVGLSVNWNTASELLREAVGALPLRDTRATRSLEAQPPMSRNVSARTQAQPGTGVAFDILNKLPSRLEDNMLIYELMASRNS